MGKIADSISSIAITLWVGGLWAIGYVAAPALFANLPDDRVLAGMLAGKMFALITWIGIGCAGYLVVFLFLQRGAAALRSAPMWLVVAMLLLTLTGHFGIGPILANLKAQASGETRDVMESLLRDRFRAWHGVSAALYLIQSLLGVALVVLQRRRSR